MCRTGFHKKVIVWLNCAQWIVTVVGSEVRVLPGSRVGPSPAPVLQWFHSCHRLIVPPITHNYSWPNPQRHSETLTKDATFLPVWSGRMRMLQSQRGRTCKSALKVSALVALHKTPRLTWKAFFALRLLYLWEKKSTYSTVAYPVHTGLCLPCPVYVLHSGQYGTLYNKSSNKWSVLHKC